MCRQGGSLHSPELSPPSLQWCEKHKRSGRQTLGDLLIKPHQRITKYPLLLQAVLKRSPEPRAQEALNAMVSTQVRLLPLCVGGWWVSGKSYVQRSLRSHFSHSAD